MLVNSELGYFMSCDAGFYPLIERFVEYNEGRFSLDGFSCYFCDRFIT